MNSLLGGSKLFMVYFSENYFSGGQIVVCLKKIEEEKIVIKIWLGLKESKAHIWVNFFFGKSKLEQKKLQ